MSNTNPLPRYLTLSASILLLQLCTGHGIPALLKGVMHLLPLDAYVNAPVRTAVFKHYIMEQLTLTRTYICVYYRCY